MITRKLLVLGLIIILLMAGCNLPFDSDGDDYEEWDEPDTEVYIDDGDDESNNDSESDLFDDEAPPVLENDLLFPRDFSFELPLFTPDSAWNQRTDQAAVLPESDALPLRNIGQDEGDLG